MCLPSVSFWVSKSFTNMHKRELTPKSVLCKKSIAPRCIMRTATGTLRPWHREQLLSNDLPPFWECDISCNWYIGYRLQNPQPTKVKHLLIVSIFVLHVSYICLLHVTFPTLVLFEGQVNRKLHGLKLLFLLCIIDVLRLLKAEPNLCLIGLLCLRLK